MMVYSVQSAVAGHPDAAFDPLGIVDAQATFAQISTKEIQHGRLSVVPLSDAHTPTTFDPQGLTDDPTSIARLMGVEIQHGRLAMFSMLDYNLQAIVTGQDPTDSGIFHIDSPAGGHTFKAVLAAHALLKASCNIGSEPGDSSTVATYERHPTPGIAVPDLGGSSSVAVGQRLARIVGRKHVPLLHPSPGIAVPDPVGSPSGAVGQRLARMLGREPIFMRRAVGGKRRPSDTSSSSSSTSDTSSSSHRQHKKRQTQDFWRARWIKSLPYLFLLYALLWSGRVTSMCSPMHVVQLPSWCYVGHSSGAPRRRRRVLRHQHRWHYSNLPGWYVLLLTLIHVGLPIWTPPHVHDTCTQPHTAPLCQSLARPRLPGLILWDLAQRLIRLSNDVHPNPGPSPPPRPDLSFLTLNVGGPFLSRRRWGHLLAEIIAEQPAVVALQEFRFRSGSHHAAWTAAMDGDYLSITYGDENPDTQFLVHNSISRYVSKLPSMGSQAWPSKSLSLATHRTSSPTSTGHFCGTNVKSWTNALHNCRTWASLWETSTIVCGGVLPSQPGTGTRSSNPEPCWTRSWHMRQTLTLKISPHIAGVAAWTLSCFPPQHGTFTPPSLRTPSTFPMRVTTKRSESQ